MSDQHHTPEHVAAAATGIALLLGALWKAVPMLRWIGGMFHRCVMFVPLAIGAPYRIAEIGDMARESARKLEGMEINQNQMKEALADVRSIQFADMDISKFGIWFSDQSGACTWANQTLCRMTGRSETEIMGWEWMNMIHPEDRERVTKAWVDAVRYGHSFRETYRYITPDGGSVSVKVIAARRVHSDSGKSVGFLGRAELA